jgi:hypothetical protein
MREVAHVVLILVMVMMTVPFATASPYSDPVVVDVVRLLGEGLSPELVSEWLEKTGKKPTKLSADDLIILKKAGASETLVQELVYLAGTKEASVPAAEPAAEAEPPSGPAKLNLTLDFTPWRSSADGWNLFVYCNGEFLIWSPGNRDQLDLTREMEPGRYVLRFLLERHTSTGKKKKPYIHDAKVSLRPIELEMKPGSSWKVALTASGEGAEGALSWKIERNLLVVDQDERRGAPFSDWPKLCEEILANIKQSRWQSKATREALMGCAEWESLWPGVAEFPTRNEVRKKLEADQFRPVF